MDNTTYRGMCPHFGHAIVVPNPEMYGDGWSVKVNITWGNYGGDILIPFSSKESAERALQKIGAEK